MKNSDDDERMKNAREIQLAAGGQTCMSDE